jgi:8-oxo-dGTP pyrophosphatase MutT (NUDIX family)
MAEPGRPASRHFVPTSVKGVVVREGAVLLCRNPRGNWELPGGRPDVEDATLVQTLTRELHEETGLEVVVERLVFAELFRPVPESCLAVIVYRAGVVGDGEAVRSDEHTEVAFFRPDALPEPLPEVYRQAIAAATA